MLPCCLCSKLALIEIWLITGEYSAIWGQTACGVCIVVVCHHFYKTSMSKVAGSVDPGLLLECAREGIVVAHHATLSTILSMWQETNVPFSHQDLALQGCSHGSAALRTCMFTTFLSTLPVCIVRFCFMLQLRLPYRDRVAV